MAAVIQDAASAIDDGGMNGFQIGVAALCTVVAMLDGFDTQSIAFVAPRIAEDWAISMAAFGPIFGAGLLGLTIGALCLSPLSDRYGRKVVLLASVTMFGMFALATAASQTMTHLIILRLLTGIGLGGAMPNIIALTNEYAPKTAKATLVTIMFCGFPLGSMIGGFATPSLIAAYGWQSVFIVGGMLPLMILPVLVFALPESARFLASRAGGEVKLAAILRRVSPDLSVDKFIGLTRAGNGLGSSGSPVAALFREGRARRTTLVWIAFFMNLLVMYFLINWLPSLLKSQGLPLETAIQSTALLNLGGVVGGVALGWLIDRRDPYLVLGTVYLCAAACVATIAFAGISTALLFTAALASGVTVLGAQIGLNAVVAAAYPAAIRSTGIGWALGIGRIGSILGPVLGGILLNTGFSAQSLILFTIGPALTAAVAVFLLRQS